MHARVSRTPADGVRYVEVDGKRLEYACWAPSSPVALSSTMPVIVLLHEGLGAISMWRDFPAALSQATGCQVMAYSRAGYASSDVGPARQIDYLHHEGQVVLPRLLTTLGIEKPVLFGHSDGASIALLCAGGGGVALTGIVVEAPHVFVEARSLAGIHAACEAYRDPAFRARLARHHADVDRVFNAWKDTWLAPWFRDWNIEDCLPHIACPVLAIQGEADEYGTMAQLERIAAQVPAQRCELLKLADCGHVPHRDRPADVLTATEVFVRRIFAL